MKSQEQPELTLGEMFEADNNLWPSSWEKHCQEWINNPYNAETLIIRYEDLLSNPLPQLRSISNFVGRHNSDERLMEIYNGSSIDRMRAIATKFGWYNTKTKLTNNFLRKGKAGSWKEEMNQDLIKRFNARAKTILEYYKYSI
jgi:hypothetical protein